MKRWLPIGLALLLAGQPAAGQEYPKPTQEGREALTALLEKGIAAGALKQVKNPKGGDDRVILADPDKLPAVMKAERRLLTPQLRDVLVALWESEDVEGKRALVALLRAAGEETGDDQARGFALVFGAAFSRQKEPKQALKEYQEAARLFQGAGQPLWAAMSWSIRGELCRDARDFAGALYSHQEALTLRQAAFAKPHLLTAASLVDLGRDFAAQGKPAQALEQYRQALALQDKAGEGPHPLKVVTLNLISLEYYQAGKVAEALEYYQQMLRMQEKLDPRPNAGVARTLGTIGDLYRRQRDFPRALEAQRRALALWRRIHAGPHLDIARTLTDIGYLCSEQGEDGEAIEHYREAIAVLEKAHQGQHSALAFALRLEAWSHGKREEYDAALGCYLRQLEVQKQLVREPHPSLADILTNIGRTQARRFDFSQALAYHQQALDMRRLLFKEPHPTLAESLGETGDAYHKQGRFAAALVAYRQRLDLLRRLHEGPHQDLVTALGDVGTVCQDLGRYKEALEYQQQALDMQRRLDSRPSAELAFRLMMLGAVYGHLGNPGRMEEHFRQGLAVMRQATRGPDPELARYLSILATTSELLGRLTLALGYEQEALKLRREHYVRPHLSQLGSLTSLASIYGNLGEIDKAEVSHQQAQELLRQCADQGGAVHVYWCFGRSIALEKKREFDQALDWARLALALARAKYPPPHPLIATCLQRVSSVARELTDYPRALEGQEQALAMLRQLHDAPHPDVAGCLVELGRTYAAQGNPSNALACQLQALELLRRCFSSPHPQVADCLANVAAAHSQLGDYKEALRLREEANTILTRVYEAPSQQLALVLMATAGLCLEHRDSAKVLHYQRQALDLLQQLYTDTHPLVAQALFQVGAAYGASGDHDRALKYLDRALVALRVRDEAELPAVAKLRPEDLRPLLLTIDVLHVRALEVEKRVTGTAQLRSCQRGYALALAELDRVLLDTLHGESGKLLLGSYKSNLPPRFVGACRQLFEQEHQAEDLRAALAAVERNRARVFVESLRQARASSLGEVGEQLRARETDLRQRLRTCNALLEQEMDRAGREPAARLRQLWDDRDRLEADLRQLAADLTRAHPRYAALRYPEPCSLEEARVCLGPDEVAVLYILGDEASYALLVEKTPAGDPAEGLAIIPLPPARQIAAKVAALTNRQTLESTARARDLGADAYAMLLAPLAGRIGKKHLVIVPDGELGYLPFELLVDPNDRFLIETRRIRYAPSLTALHLVRLWEEKRPAPTRPLWAVGDPVYGGGDPRLARPAAVEGEAFPRLPRSGDEVRAVARALKVPQKEVRLGPDATEAAIKAASASGELAQARYVHFAVHGLLGQGPRQQPALVLSQVGVSPRRDETGTDDGFLSLGEVAGLSLNADLVVLSACETGRGQLYNGEGVIGLARAFLHAGSRGVVCSLWQVDDEQTARLMASLYEKLAPGAGTADALWQARLQLCKEGKAPLHWAPFLLIGR